ncbi:MAG: SDR family oxidoreductase [Pseudomonadota bacterium]
MLNIAITGASGLVGKSLCHELVLRKFNVSAFTRGSHNLLENVQYHMIVDIENGINWDAMLDKVDVIVHLAARVHVMQDTAKNPLQDFLAVNLHGTVNLAQAAAKAGVKRFVFVSSIKVNGEFTENQPFSESDIPQPQDAYAISKWEAEKALRKIEKETGMQVVIVRPPLVYGAGVKANFASLLKVVNKKWPLPLASVQAKRSLIYVGNLVDAVIVCALNPKAAGQTYLVSDGEAVSMPQLIKKMALSLNKPSYILPFPVSTMRLLAKAIGKLASVDRLTQSLVIDSSKIRQELDWKPPFTMDQGLKVTADWYKKSLESGRL